MFQNLNDPSYNFADVLDNIGRASYSIGFTTGTAFNIKELIIPCGKNTLEPVLRKYQIPYKLKMFQEKIFTTTYQHPLLELEEEFQPELMKNYIDDFVYSAKVSLSCLLGGLCFKDLELKLRLQFFFSFFSEESQGKSLDRTLNMISSASNRKIRLLTTFLEDKISDIGGSTRNHWCLENSIP